MSEEPTVKESTAPEKARHHETIVSGIVLRLRRTTKSMGELSLKGKIALLIVAGLAIDLVADLILLALRSHRGIGVPVVATTFLVAIAISAARVLQKHLVSSGLLSRTRGRLFFVGLSGAFCGAAAALAYLLVPQEGATLPVSLTVGNVMLAALFILAFDLYPQLADRGTPGLITAAGLVIVFAITYMTGISLYIVPYDPFTLNVGPLLSPPTEHFPLGTTQLGQDMLSRTIAGGAVMLQVAVLSVAVCFSTGVTIGLIASYRGGIADRVASLIMDSIFAFPGLVLAIAIAAMLRPGVVNMALAIAVVYIPSYFRVIRSQVLSVKELPYVEAAIVMGARDRDILLRYVLPNVLPSAVVVMSINFADAVLTAAGLTFIGLGLPIDVPDWGWDLTFGRMQLQFGAWWVITFPGIMIVLLALGFTLAGEGLNEILMPKLTE